MQDDQISQSVDEIIGQKPEDNTSGQSPVFSLGTNPLNQQQSSGPPPQIIHPDQPLLQTPSDDTAQPVGPSTASDELLDIKQQALNQLAPIVSELDQNPEQKYRTLMMLIQASDDQSLVKSAYEAANKIENTQVRAEALLSIVNEINYFSGSSQQDHPNNNSA